MIIKTNTIDETSLDAAKTKGYDLEKQEAVITHSSDLMISCMTV